MARVISVVVDHHVAGPYRDATLAALDHALGRLSTAGPAGPSAPSGIRVRTVPTAEITAAFARRPGDGVVIGPGSPYDNPAGVIEVIRSARERGVPLVGT